MTQTQLDQVEKALTNHPPCNPTQVPRYEEIRAAAKAYAVAVLQCCPSSRELSLAMTNLEQSVMWAVAAIARNETSDFEPHTPKDDAAPVQAPPGFETQRPAPSPVTPPPPSSPPNGPQAANAPATQTTHVDAAGNPVPTPATQVNVQ